jgi:hypothetical protein
MGERDGSATAMHEGQAAESTPLAYTRGTRVRRESPSVLGPAPNPFPPALT